MKTIKKVISIFAIFFAIVAIKGCIRTVGPHTVCFECDITDFKVSTTWSKNDTLKYTNLSWGFDAGSFWECTNKSCQFNINLIKSTYASDAEFLPKGEINSIDIYSNADYDSLHPAGISLNDVFILYAKYADIDSIESIISDIQFPITTYKILYFYINQNLPPDSLRLHEFTVIYKEIDSTVITKTLPAVYVSP